MNWKKIMCTDKSLIINSVIFHKQKELGILVSWWHHHFEMKSSGSGGPGDGGESCIYPHRNKSPTLHHSQTSHHSTWLISNIERLLLDTAQLERKLQIGDQKNLYLVHWSESSCTDLLLIITCGMWERASCS